MTGEPSGLVVLDIDPRNGGTDALADLEQRQGPLPPTVEAITGGGGRHFYFRHPGHRVKSRSGLAPGVDVKADGGYVVAAPSLHGSGRSYSWADRAGPADATLADWPAWMVEPSHPRDEPAASVVVPLGGGATIPQGKRNSTLASYAGRLRHVGCDEKATLAALLSVNSRRCVPPLTEAEVAAIARSIASYPASQHRGPAVIRLSDVRSESIRWLWPNRIPLGKLSALAGHPGLGKSFVTLDLAARVSTGAPLPGCAEERNPPAGVVLLSAEDDLSDTIRPRLEAAGADLSRIVAVQGLWRPGDSTPATITLGDLPALEEAIAGVADCKLVVIDPVSAYMPANVDDHRNTDVRSLLAPLGALAAGLGVAIVMVTHLNKSQATKGITRIMGSLAIPAAARAVWLVVEDEADRATRRKLLPVKMNLAQNVGGLGFSIEGKPGRVEWSSQPIMEHADDALAAEGSDPGESSALDEACDWLADVLSAGGVPANEVKRRAEADGIAPATLSRAKSRLQVVSYRDGFGEGSRWVWALPKSEGDQP